MPRNDHGKLPIESVARSFTLPWFGRPIHLLGLIAILSESAADSKARPAAENPRLHLRWGQTNTTLSIAVDVPKSLDCVSESGLMASPASDRILFSFRCDGSSALDGLKWEFELREDIVAETSRVERLSVGGLLLVLKKQTHHRWDRLLWDETEAVVSKDWKREDRNLPEEDEVELPRAYNIRRYTYDELVRVASESVVVAAMRYPWCSGCGEKDSAYVKATKKLANKDEFAGVIYCAIDLRENKAAARQWKPICKKDSCPLHVFKPDEPLDEPYKIEMRLLYEMDEYAMMTDPLAGAPGHTPKGQNIKPDFERFESDLRLLLPAAVTPLKNVDAAGDFQSRLQNAVVGSSVDYYSFRQTARKLRGVASFGFVQDACDGSLPACPENNSANNPSANLKIFAAAATAERTPLLYSGSVQPVEIEELEHFVRVHTEPLLQNYTWDLKNKFERIGLAVGVLWVNYSDLNNTNVTRQALEAFTALCDRRRGTNATQHIICCVMDESYAYYQREYGNHEPYPYPYFGLTKKLGFGEGDRFGFLFKEPQNQTASKFFSKPKRAAKEMSSWISKVLSGRIPVSHESGVVSAQAKWVRGTVQDIVWKTYQKEINGSTADTLLELYDNQRKQSHISEGTLRVVAAALKDYSSIKVARMETSQNYVQPIFGRKQYSKDTEYYWIPPSIVPGEWAPENPVRYTGSAPITPEKLLNFFKKHTLSRWSLKEALETTSDLSPEILGQARAVQREDDRADEEKQQMIKKMMTTLKKEKGLVDVGEMMGLKKAAETVGSGEAAGDNNKKKKASKSGKGADKGPTSNKEADKAAEEKRRAERREQLKREDERLKKAEKKEKERKKQRREADKRRKELKKAKEAEVRKREAAEFERKKKAREAKEKERRMAPTTPYFAWGQAREEVRITVSIPSVDTKSLNITIRNDSVAVRARDTNGRSFTLGFELREFVQDFNSSWSIRYSEENKPRPDGINMALAKVVAHRWDRLAQNHTAVKLFMKKDWVQDDGDLEEEEDIDLPSGPNLKKLTAAALSKMIESNTMVMAALRLPWCDKCVEKDKHFAKAAKTTKDKDLIGSIIFAIVDVREEKYLGRKYNATCDDKCNLHIFKKDEPEEPYVVPGRRYHEEIQIDCYKHLLPVVNEVSDKATFERVSSAFDTAIVGFFRGGKLEDAWYPRFRAAARELRGHALFGAIFEGREPQEFGIDHNATPADPSLPQDTPDRDRPLVLLFKPKENRHVEFTGDLSLDKLSHFSRVLSLPLVSTYEFESRQKYQELKVPLGMMWLDADKPDRDENVQAKRILNRLAIRFSGHLVFVMLNSTRDGLLMRPMGLDPRRAPTFGISRSDEMESDRYGFDMQAYAEADRRAFWANEEQAFERLESFCAAFLDDTLEVSHESAELPPSYRWYGPGIVHEVVWKTFRESVYRTEHDVLLELYSPFRPQHRTYVTVLDLVAESLANVTNLKVARMDTANNYVLPEFGLKDKEKSSTLFFIPAAPERFRRPRRFGGRSGKAEALPEKLLRFVHRELGGKVEMDLKERIQWISREANRRIKRLRALEKDYEKKMQEEWMQKEMEEFERYKRLGKFDNLPVN